MSKKTRTSKGDTIYVKHSQSTKSKHKDESDEDIYHIKSDKKELDGKVNKDNIEEILGIEHDNCVTEDEEMGSHGEDINPDLSDLNTEHKKVSVTINKSNKLTENNLNINSRNSKEVKAPKGSNTYSTTTMQKEGGSNNSNEGQPQDANK